LWWLGLLLTSQWLTNPLNVLNCPDSARIGAEFSPSTRLAQPVPLVIERDGTAFTQGKTAKLQANDSHKHLPV
jgi:hypothetical protein